MLSTGTCLSTDDARRRGLVERSSLMRVQRRRRLDRLRVYCKRKRYSAAAIALYDKVAERSGYIQFRKAGPLIVC